MRRLLSVCCPHSAQLTLSGGAIERDTGFLHFALCRSGTVDSCQ
jgi:hypothetical protein